MDQVIKGYREKDFIGLEKYSCFGSRESKFSALG
jgi:hypothetical protein